MYQNGLNTIEKPTTLSITSTGVLYRNPIPHLRSIQAYFPSVVSMDNGEMLATVVLGEAFEAVNLATHIARSVDGGEAWQLEGPLNASVAGKVTSNFSRITALPNGELVVLTARSDRTDHVDEGLTNEANMGFVPVELLLFRSYDYGRTWSEAEILSPPLEGPSFEICAPITILNDGRWVLPTSTWRGWDGYCPNGMKMVGLVSHDQGKTWPEYWNVMDGSDQKIIYWESKIVEIEDSTLVAVAWVYNEEQGKDLENHYAISEDGGQTWSQPSSTGIQGQTIASMSISDNRLLSVYRRIDKPGLWVTISRLEGGDWVNIEHFPIWGTPELKVTKQESGKMVEEFQNLKFGAPCLLKESDSSILVYFWCYEANISNIRWIRMELS